MKHVLKPIVVGVLTASLLSGCMGKFALTDKVYSWNKSVSKEKWVNEGVFIAMLVVPVYYVTYLIDGVVLNSIDWWTGSNPLAHAGDQKRVTGADGSVALMTLRSDGGIDVDMTSAKGEATRITLQKVGDQVAVLDKDGVPMSAAF